MAVREGELWPWAGRLQDAVEAVHRAARWLVSSTEGPFSTVLRMAASDVWGGPFADQLRGALRSLDGALVPWADHLVRLHTALDQAVTEVQMAIAAEASGIPSTYDPVAALAPWRRWPAPSLPLHPGWAHGAGGGAGFVWVYPDRARQLASQLRAAAEELRAGSRRLAAALAPLLIDAPVGFDLVANAADEVAAEALRRVEALEEADRRTAGTFVTVGEQLGFPVSLAPPAGFNQAELRALQRAPAGAGPGRQLTQVTVEEPVSTATGNFLYEAVDLALPGRGLPTVVARTYNSLRADCPRQAVHRHRDCTISRARSGESPLLKVREGDRRALPEGNHLGRQDGKAGQMSGPIALGGLLIVLGLLATLESVLDKDLAGRPLLVFGLLLVVVGAILVVAGLVERFL